MTRSGRVRTGMLSALVLVLTAACAGPPDPLSVGVREFPSDVVLGAQADAATRPLPVPPTSVALSGPGAPLAPFDDPRRRLAPGAASEGVPSTTTVATPPTPCPADDPLEPPARQATSRIFGPPPPGPLPFRNEGSYTASGFNPRTVPFPPSSTRTVGGVERLAQGFRYDVAAELSGDVTTTTYEVATGSAVPGGDGLYLVQIVTRTADGRAGFPFRPPVPLKLVDLPAVAGTTFTTAGTDPASGTTMSYTSVVGPKVRVNACGVPLDAIELRLENGRVDGPEANVEFELTIALGTQYGGLSLRDVLRQTGRLGQDLSAVVVNRATIDREPGS